MKNLEKSILALVDLQKSYWRHKLQDCWVGELADGFRRASVEETPPTKQTRSIRKDAGLEPWQQSRNETSPQPMTMMHKKIVENVEGEALKRLSYKVKGQIGAQEQSARGAGSPLSQMPSINRRRVTTSTPTLLEAPSILQQSRHQTRTHEMQ